MGTDESTPLGGTLRSKLMTKFDSLLSILQDKLLSVYIFKIKVFKKDVRNTIIASTV